MRTTACLGLVALFACGACTAQSTAGRVSFGLYDCEVADTACASRAPEPIEVPALVSGEGSRAGAAGLVVVAHLRRASGASALLSLDLAPGRMISATYTEWLGGVVSFNGTGEGGKVVMGSALSGRFSLRFVDPGPDGLLGTGDDRVRTLVGGSYWLSPAPAPSVDPLPAVDLSIDFIDVEASGPDDTAEAGGCGGTSDPGSDPAGGSSGCGGGSDPSSDSSSSSGCGSGSEPSGGESSSSGCQSAGAARKAHSRRLAGGGGRFVPLAVVALFLKARRRAR